MKKDQGISFHIPLKFRWMPILWQYWLLNLFLGEKELFLNYGFLSTSEATSGLQDGYDPQTTRLGLYRYVASRVSLEGYDVLEVGSGRGGGAAYIMECHKPKSLVGLDFCPNAVRFCQQYYLRESLVFQTGRAEELPFPDQSFDVVINIESSHLYRSIEQFLREATRVLRKKGHLLLADMRTEKGIALLRQQFIHTGLSIVAEQQITENVLAALKQDNAFRKTMIQQEVPWFLRPDIRQIAAVKDSRMYRSLQNGTVQYWSFVLQNQTQRAGLS